MNDKAEQEGVLTVPTQHGSLTFDGRNYPVAHAALVLIPPSEGDSSFSLYLHADALATGGGFLMLDHLPVGKVTNLEDLAGACISFRGDDPDSRDTVGSEPSDLATSGWTFPGYEEDDSKSWRFDSFHAVIQGLGGNRYRITLKCQLSNWANDQQIEGEADIEAIGAVGTPPTFDTDTNTWSETEP